MAKPEAKAEKDEGLAQRVKALEADVEKLKQVALAAGGAAHSILK
jgi:hypothetical protein